MSAPFVTIVIPLFQGAAYISETLDSIAPSRSNSRSMRNLAGAIRKECPWITN